MLNEAVLGLAAVRLPLAAEITKCLSMGILLRQNKARPEHR